MTKTKTAGLVLVVDDAADTREIVKRNLTRVGYEVYLAGDVPAALAVLDTVDVDLVITDLKLPGQSGLDLVRHVRENLRDTEVMMITGYASIAGAVEAVKSGAEEYVAKPFTDDELLAAVKRSFEKLARQRERRRTEPTTGPVADGLLGKSTALTRVRDAIAKAAATRATVLITGESGTGKELVARAIHYQGARRAASFVPINCAGIPEGLLESELFGYVKGAFTGATETRTGFFQVADGGTIFLDEIGEISPAIQVKLLRVLQDKKVTMVGDTKARQIDVRIVAATNKDLASHVARGAFREDLFFRLNVINIDVPPLRERRDDVPLLVHHFLKKYGMELGRTPRFSERAMDLMQSYAWPGNVRELENVVQRLLVMNDAEVIDAPDLPQLMRFTAEGGFSTLGTLAEVEAEHLRRVLAACGNNKTRAAQILGIDRKTLREKLRRYVIDDGD